MSSETCKYQHFAKDDSMAVNEKRAVTRNERGTGLTSSRDETVTTGSQFLWITELVDWRC
jgi:hypothetical protein